MPVFAAPAVECSFSIFHTGESGTVRVKRIHLDTPTHRTLIEMHPRTYSPTWGWDVPPKVSIFRMTAGLYVPLNSAYALTSDEVISAFTRAWDASNGRPIIQFIAMNYPHLLPE